MKNLFVSILLLALTAFNSWDSAAWGRQAQTQKPIDDDVLTYFYRDPRPDRLLNFLELHDITAQGWESFPAIAGFFGVVFARYPNWIDRLIPGDFSGRMADTIRAAIRLSNSKVSKDLSEKLAAMGSDKTLREEFNNLPASLADLNASTPIQLEILWGASFASANQMYIQKIWDAYADTADQSLEVAGDVALVADWMAGVGDFPAEALKSKYSDEGIAMIISSASALWSLLQNAQSHKFVGQMLKGYAQSAVVSTGPDGSAKTYGGPAAWTIRGYLEALPK